jgi:cyclopropane fatty-acyl-phospholipid synthase-like methyltransferase
MWFATIMPRIGWKLPTSRVLEIAPGFGRCTEFLLRFTTQYVGIDLSDQCVAHCRRRFANRAGATFHVNDGLSLGAAPDYSFDLVFSYESLVHADLNVLRSYVPQIITKLRRSGVAFIQHSNLAEAPGAEWGLRATDVSAALVSDCVERHGGRVLIQEIFAGGDVPASDCFSTFCRAPDYPGAAPIVLRNTIARECAAASECFQRYAALG